MWAGYPKRTRELVIKRVLARDSNNKWNYTNLGRPLYRDRDSRKVNIKLDKSSWFRASGHTATITVPASKGSSLTQKVKETLKLHTGLVEKVSEFLRDQVLQYSKN